MSKPKHVRAAKDVRHIIAKRAQEAARAEQVFTTAQAVSDEVFRVFCQCEGLPDGCELLSVDATGVLVKLPEPKKPTPGDPGR